MSLQILIQIIFEFMEHRLASNLLTLIAQTLHCRERLSLFKLSLQDAAFAFSEVDKGNKGYLTSHDLTQIIPLTQAQSCYILKEMKGKYEGRIEEKDLVNYVGEQNSLFSELRRKSPKQKLIDFLRVMKNNYGTLSFVKAETNICEWEIRKVFEDILLGKKTKSVESNLSLKDIVNYFGQLPKYEETLGKELKRIFPKRQSISLEYFTLLLMEMSCKGIARTKIEGVKKWRRRELSGSVSLKEIKEYGGNKTMDINEHGRKIDGRQNMNPKPHQFQTYFETKYKKINMKHLQQIVKANKQTSHSQKPTSNFNKRLQHKLALQKYRQQENEVKKDSQKNLMIRKPLQKNLLPELK